MSNKQVTTAFITYTTLGGYLKDSKNIEKDFSSNQVAAIQQALDNLLNNLITEATALDTIKSFSLETAISRITESYDACVKQRRDIEAAQAAEDILRAASVAAQVALVATSWTVFGAMGLGIASLVAEAAADGAEIGVQKLEDTITQSITDMGLKAYNDPALAAVKTYHDSADQVSVNIAKLELGGSKTLVRQSLLGLAKISKTREELKNNLIHFYDIANKPDDIIGKYTMLAEFIVNGDGGPAAQKIILDLKAAGLAPVIIKTVILTVMAAGLGLTFQVRRFTNEILKRMPNGEAILSIEDITYVAEISTKAERMVKCVKGLAVLGALLEVGLLGWNIYEQRKLIDYINEQIESRKNEFINYYTNFYDAVTSSIPPTPINDPTQGLPKITLKVFHATGTTAAHPEVTLTVPAEYKIVSGGARVNWTGEGNLLTASFPKDSQTWVAKAKDHRLSSPANIDVWAIAIYDPKSEWQVDIATKTSSPAQHPSVSAVVPSGYVLTGGGAEAHWQSMGSLLTASYPDSEKAGVWTVASKDHIDAETTTITAYAIGLQAVNGATGLSTKVVKKISASAAHPSTEVSPETGYSLIGGGAQVNYTGEGNLLTASYPDFDNNKWIVASKDHEKSDPSTITAYAIGFKTT